ncbi:MAG: DUF4974 domain-containing protein [Pedobacter sp.]|nr:MAG: DUF4974 domain-containing protein [Pedobacter sp.]
MDRTELENLLLRYKEGKCTAEEQTALERWFDEQAATGDFTLEQDEEQTTRRLIKERIDKELQPGKKNWKTVFKVAAVFLLIVNVLFYFNTEIRDIADPVVYVEKQVAAHQQLKITLSDGSIVWLNENSRFRYPEKFNRSSREVTLLEGEAYFDIHHDKEKPFLVKSGKTTTKVLGTAFNIRAYPFLSSVDIAVTRGKVSVSKDGSNENVFLLPNEKVSVDNSSGTLKKSTVDAEGITSWKQGNMVFNNETLEDVCAMLEHKFNVTIHFKQQELKDYRLTAGFSKEDSLGEILLILSKTNNLSYKLDQNSVYFSKD